MGKQSTSQTQPAFLGGAAQTYFDRNLFDQYIQQQGYRVLLEKAMVCPCKGEGTDHRSDCLNCLGTGYVFYDRVDTTVIIQGINTETQFKEWSLERAGLVSVTSRNVDLLNFMDRITILQTQDKQPVLTEFSEVVHPKVLDDGIIFAFLSYTNVQPITVRAFQGTQKPLLVLNEEQYSISDNNLIIHDDALLRESPLSISLRYKHSPQYHVVDEVRDVAHTNFLDVQNGGKLTSRSMPVNAMARRAHNIIDADRFRSNQLIDNAVIK